eukprot:Plantae.Rhodophyta-Hildenbrandia_rubra.ctg6242.p1 GENE.Plantae.Rhodophyta-Hildenbrandia_rubra.ctg6242~~Plantae.Rhodophyta-Hildenbrandia_rubra.ctg6242.p1  ORF type:complete len:390 (+),score=34.05 Plantae.Rhodophyta-Hildenbrandia_rubra.ctg6242:565-1734(+)
MAPAAADLMTNDEENNDLNSINLPTPSFDDQPAAKNQKDEIPSLAEIKRVIPKRLFRPDLALSLYYAARDVLIISLLYFGAWATYGTSYHAYYLPFFWFFAGFFFWAVFVVGHDCGHGSFSNNPFINSVVGHVLHSSILVPFHSWRISHRHHHKNTGNYERDAIFYPMPHEEYENVHDVAKFIYSSTFFTVCFAYPTYLIKGYGNRPYDSGSHLSPYSNLFTKEERNQVAVSCACWWSMVALLAACAYQYGPLKVLTYYGVPYLIYCTWLLVVTFLHHTEPGAEWYNTRNWTYVKGNLQSIDRVYGFLEHFHHDIGTHVVHHLFPKIPHYYLREANQAIKPFLGKLHKAQKVNPIAALPLSVAAWSQNHVIPQDHDEDVFVIPHPAKKC